MLVLSVPLPITGATREEEDVGGDYGGKKKEGEGRQKEGGNEEER